MSDKRVALFIPTLGGGGAERIMITLAKGFSEAGLDVDLVVCQSDGPLRNEVPESVRVVDLGSSRIIMSTLPLVRYLRQEQPCAMLVALKPSNCVAIWARALARVPLRLVVAEHNTLSVATAGTRARRMKMLPILMRWSYPRADGIVAVSNGVADDLASTVNLPRNRIETIYNPVVTEEMLVKSRERVDHPWFRPGEPPVILGVGRFTSQKDFPNLIRAFIRLRKAQAVRLMILGEGPDRGSLEALVHESGFRNDIELPGFVPNPYAYMRAATVFALSSQWEGLPTVLIEAMACGTPVVSTDCPSGPAEILQNGKRGQLVAVGDSSALHDAILKVIEGQANISPLANAVDVFRVQPAVEHYLRLLRFPEECRQP